MKKRLLISGFAVLCMTVLSESARSDSQSVVMGSGLRGQVHLNQQSPANVTVQVGCYGTNVRGVSNPLSPASEVTMSMNVPAVSSDPITIKFPAVMTYGQEVNKATCTAKSGQLSLAELLKLGYLDTYSFGSPAQTAQQAITAKLPTLGLSEQQFIQLVQNVASPFGPGAHPLSPEMVTYVSAHGGTSNTALSNALGSIFTAAADPVNHTSWRTVSVSSCPLAHAIGTYNYRGNAYSYNAPLINSSCTKAAQLTYASKYYDQLQSSSGATSSFLVSCDNHPVGEEMHQCTGAALGSVGAYKVVCWSSKDLAANNGQCTSATNTCVPHDCVFTDKSSKTLRCTHVIPEDDVSAFVKLSPTANTKLHVDASGAGAAVGNQILVDLNPKVDFKSVDLKGVLKSQAFTQRLTALDVTNYMQLSSSAAYYAAYKSKDGTISAVRNGSGNGTVDRGGNLFLSLLFPGKDGFCGSYHSPLMLFFDQKRPKFSGVSTFPLDPESGHIYWVEPGAPGYFLALDEKGDRKITSASQLFGNSDEFANGFEALKRLDSNGDGIIDEKDAAFSQLVLWQDSNGDGIAQPEEVKTLKELGVVSIDLKYRDSHNLSYGEGHAVAHGVGRFHFKDKKSGKTKDSDVIDIWFAGHRVK